MYQSPQASKSLALVLLIRAVSKRAHLLTHHISMHHKITWYRSQVESSFTTFSTHDSEPRSTTSSASVHSSASDESNASDFSSPTRRPSSDNLEDSRLQLLGDLSQNPLGLSGPPASPASNF
ncbi:hypothetical protein CEXT_463451 [Caerostris extrusa]|uniref:Uncharacterized protein n=1 Tax=Caerostris extrusa TaxID=172846 RepID=A0AAV4PCZ4_CAEEX|nr:hypothetical protein CEXT_463451 [Caerostris extrusa]